MIVIVRDVLKLGDRYVGDLVQQGPVSALVLLEGNAGLENPQGVWLPERSIDRVASIETDDDGTRTLRFESGLRMIEGTTAVLPVS